MNPKIMPRLTSNLSCYVVVQQRRQLICSTDNVMGAKSHTSIMGETSESETAIYIRVTSSSNFTLGMPFAWCNHYKPYLFGDLAEEKKVHFPVCRSVLSELVHCFTNSTQKAMMVCPFAMAHRQFKAHLLFLFVICALLNWYRCSPTNSHLAYA